MTTRKQALLAAQRIEAERSAYDAGYDYYSKETAELLLAHVYREARKRYATKDLELAFAAGFVRNRDQHEEFEHELQ